jgi:hypothetical protein
VYHEGIEETEDCQHSQHQQTETRRYMGVAATKSKVQQTETRLYLGVAATKSKVQHAKKCSRKTVLVEREEGPYL